MSSRCARARESLAACRSAADRTRRRSAAPGAAARANAALGAGALAKAARHSRLIALILVLLVLPSPADAQRDRFFPAVLTFYRSLAGVYGDEGPRVAAQLDEMSAALARWDAEIRAAERELGPRLPSADAQTQLQIHTLLASLYLERGRFSDSLREFDQDISIDPKRAAFHRLRGLVLQQMSRFAEAADAFRTAWLLDPADAQNAYRSIAYRSARATEQETEQALATLATVERGLIRRERPGAPALFTNVRGIADDAGGAMAFVPAAYASGFAFVLRGELDRGLAEFRNALASDPLVNDPVHRSEPMARGIAALRQSMVPEAGERLAAEVADAGDSSEALSVFATA